MSLPVHTVNQGQGSTGFSEHDKITVINLAQTPYPAGNGDPTAAAVSSAGVYSGVPTAAYANEGNGSGATVTTHMSVIADPTVAAGGSGGTNGAVTLTGSGDTGTEYQLNGTIAGNALTAITGIAVAGNLTAIANITAAAVTGGSLSGAKVNLTACLGLLSLVTADGSSNHEYPQSTTVALSGGSPVTAGVPGNVTITAVAGQGSEVVVAGLNLPETVGVLIGDLGQDATAYVGNRTSSNITINVNPRLASATLAAGNVDIVITH